MADKVYYDAGSFAYFFLKNNKRQKYSPLKIMSEKSISPSVLEEFSHTFIKGHDRGTYNYFSKNRKTRIKKFGELIVFRSLFSMDNVDSTELSDLFITISQVILQKGSIKKIGFYDIIHLSHALLSGCTTIVTCDGGFRQFGKSFMEDLLKPYKLRKIVIYKHDFSRILDEVLL